MGRGALERRVAELEGIAQEHKRLRTELEATKSELREKADFLPDKPARQELPPEMRDEYGKFANILVLFHHDVTVTGCTARDVTSEYIRSYPADHDDL